ncbi:lipopolysaccharide-induced transcription factor regulating tumor necrosis factor alpha, putative [Pediculus humanus corporis]|uniref:Lipopolysaccharide-induced transcription factor regulating tumor necrosis factor alpha, putative n=1 Tax=Pediculus humanus subsp. corporis TaxID=121224 RepID=E0VEE2_PEDHC|nr:lipopolysaccharide-induced transcription factor regulating tumor necrosis factor alpha, putative [Pediculus humanus corporis]EEB11748.1 lipopolysaccharide-induced transcription factor regulating tumor necrosis factor alpha, putative [Pediculus humanus corporis]
MDDEKSREGDNNTDKNKKKYVNKENSNKTEEKSNFILRKTNSLETLNINREDERDLHESNSFLTSENNQSIKSEISYTVLSTKSVQDVLIRETNDNPPIVNIKDLFHLPSSSSQSTSHIISNKNETTVTDRVSSENHPTDIDNEQITTVTNTKDTTTGSSSIPRTQIRILSTINVDQPGSRRCSIVVTERPPPLPPAYTGDQDLYASRENEELNRVCLLLNFLCLASFAEPIWRSHSQPAYCPRCGILVLTTTHAHESVATHVAALALCLFGCWPCCILPYCMNVCKNTYHYCSVCQLYLGSYTPW